MIKDECVREHFNRPENCENYSFHHSNSFFYPENGNKSGVFFACKGIQPELPRLSEQTPEADSLKELVSSVF